MSPEFLQSVALYLPPHSSLLFPNLRDLCYYTLTDSPLLFRLLLSPNLSNLEISTGLTGTITQHAHQMVSLALTTCRLLRSLRLVLYSYDRKADTSPACQEAAKALVDFLNTEPAIEELFLWAPDYVSPLLIKLISHLPCLKSLIIECPNGMSMSSADRSTDPQCTSLRFLQIEGPVSAAIHFARMKCSLSRLVFTCPGADMRDMQRWIVDANGCYGCNLREIALNLALNEVWDGSELPHFVAGLPLVTLRLDVTPSIDMTDQALGNLGLAVPPLEELSIAPPHGISRAATLRGVLSLLRNCPKMKFLRLDFDARMDETELKSLSIPASALAKLSVQTSSITNSTAVAELFSRAFPYLISMIWDPVYNGDSNGEDTSLWQVVWDLQQSVRQKGDIDRLSGAN
jgi:hypothetical protein